MWNHLIFFMQHSKNKTCTYIYIYLKCKYYCILLLCILLNQLLCIFHSVKFSIVEIIGMLCIRTKT